MYKNGPHNVQADAFFRLRKLAKTVVDVWDEISSFLLSNKFLEQTKMIHVADIPVPLKRRYKYTHRDFQLQGSDDATYDSTRLEDMAPDESFATLPVFSSADSMPISIEKLATAQFYDAF